MKVGAISGINSLVVAETKRQMKEKNHQDSQGIVLQEVLVDEDLNAKKQQGPQKIMQQGAVVRNNYEGLFSKLPTELKIIICKLLSEKSLACFGSVNKGFMSFVAQIIASNENIKNKWGDEQRDYYSNFAKNILENDIELSISSILNWGGGKIKRAQYIKLEPVENMKIENYLAMLDAFGSKENILELTLKMPWLFTVHANAMIDKLEDIFRKNKDISCVDLDFSDVELTDDNLIKLLPLIPKNTHRLFFDYGRFGDESVESLISCFNNSSISKLSMSFYNPPNPDDAPDSINFPNISVVGLERLLVAWPKNIKELILYGDIINGEVFHSILKNLPNSLETLVFSNNNINSLNFQNRQKLPECIKRLYLVRNNMSEDDISILMCSLIFPKGFDCLFIDNRVFNYESILSHQAKAARESEVDMA